MEDYSTGSRLCTDGFGYPSPYSAYTYLRASYLLVSAALLLTHVHATPPPRLLLHNFVVFEAHAYFRTWLATRFVPFRRDGFLAWGSGCDILCQRCILRLLDRDVAAAPPPPPM